MRHGQEKSWKEQGRAWTKKDRDYQNLVCLHVGQSDENPVDIAQPVLSKPEAQAVVFKARHAPGHTLYISTGCFQNLASSICRMTDVPPSGNPIVIMLSDWEEGTLEMAKTIWQFRLLARRLAVPFVMVMASQAELREP